VEEALRLVTVNPATMTGFEDLAGAVAVGRPANLVAVDANGVLVASIQNDQPVRSSTAH
jgi:imidazolonepropionase-like amidohydrolase